MSQHDPLPGQDATAAPSEHTATDPLPEQAPATGEAGVDVRELSARVTVPDRDAAAAAAERLSALAARHGGLGRLGELAGWLAGVRGSRAGQPLDRVRLVVLAADHGIAGARISRHEPGWTAEAVRALHEGSAPSAVVARECGVGLRVVDVGVDVGVDGDAADLPAAVRAHKVLAGSADARREDALGPAQTAAAFRAGAALVDEEVDAGVDLLLLGDVGVGATAVAAVLVGACLRSGPLEVVGRDVGPLDDATWMRRTAAVRDALRRSRPVAHQPLNLLAAVGGADSAAAVGFLVQAAVRRTPVLLDGSGSAAAALVASRVSLTAKEWWQVGPRSTQPAQALALQRLGMEPLTDLRLGTGAGLGALAALPVLRAAHAVLDAAGGGLDAAGGG